MSAVKNCTVPQAVGANPRPYGRHDATGAEYTFTKFTCKKETTNPNGVTKHEGTNKYGAPMQLDTKTEDGKTTIVGATVESKVSQAAALAVWKKKETDKRSLNIEYKKLCAVSTAAGKSPHPIGVNAEKTEYTFGTFKCADEKKNGEGAEETIVHTGTNAHGKAMTITTNASSEITTATIVRNPSKPDKVTTLEIQMKK